MKRRTEGATFDNGLANSWVATSMTRLHRFQKKLYPLEVLADQIYCSRENRANRGQSIQNEKFSGKKEDNKWVDCKKNVIVQLNLLFFDRTRALLLTPKPHAQYKTQHNLNQTAVKSYTAFIRPTFNSSQFQP